MFSNFSLLLKLFTLFRSCGIFLPGVRFAYATVEQLSPSHDYQFRVIAENLYGRSEPCEPTALIKTDTEQEGRKKKGLTVEGSQKENI